MGVVPLALGCDVLAYESRHLGDLVGREAWGWHPFSDPRLAGSPALLCTTRDFPQLFRGKTVKRRHTDTEHSEISVKFAAMMNFVLHH